MAAACSTSARWARPWAKRRRAPIGWSIGFVGRTGSAAATSAFGRWNGNPWKNRKPRCCAQARGEALLFTGEVFARTWRRGTLNQFERLRTSATMPDLADLYPGFASHWIDTTAGRIFARSGGERPPLLLLHRYPPTNLMWPPVAPAPAGPFRPVLARFARFRLVRRAAIRCRARALHQARHGRRHDRGDGGARSRALSPRRARSRRPRRLSARARPSRAARTARRARHRADLGHVAP